jgi:nucleoside-diphosphate-sugar epimerase
MMVLVTGGGFVSFSLASRLLRQDESVFGIDNLAPSCYLALKEARLPC